MPTYDTTSKYGSRALTGTNVISDIDTGFKSLRDDLEAIIASAFQGTLAARPTSSGGSPGKSGRFYWATDTSQLFYDYGTGWALVYQAETWRVVGASGQPAFTNSWTAVTAGSARPPAFCLQNGMVLLAGHVTGPNSSTPAFTLPVGYRPAKTMHMPAAAVASGSDSLDAVHAAFVTVFADGRVNPAYLSGADSVSLDGIAFRAEQ
jgi:hypothetical protein